jgi:drug/metabolite transporter (DMT)-like permease
VTRLRRIGFALAFGAPIVVAVDQLLNKRLFDALPREVKAQLTLPGFSIPWAPIVAGIGAFILAAVFEYGLRLREDVEATV